MKRIYGFGIVDRHGEPWWDESCVCKDRAPLLGLVADMNYDGPYKHTPYRVVKLFWTTKRRKVA